MKYNSLMYRPDSVNTEINEVNVSGSYDHSLNKIIYKIKELLKQGFKPEWSCSERYCTINGQTFNIAKPVFDRRIKM